MVLVHHGGHTVKAKAVELKLVQPVARVGQQVTQRLPVTIVEAARVPHPVVALRAGVEVHAVGAIKHVDAVHDVLGGMAVHDVHQHHQAHAVRLVDHGLELVGGAAARRGRKEVGHVVAKGAVVRVLLDGHNLDGVVAIVADARQHILLEVGIRVDDGLLVGHTDVALVDAQRARALRARVLEHILLVLLQHARCRLLQGLVVHAVELDLIPLLSGKLDPGGNPLEPLAPVGLHLHLHLGAVLNSGLPIDVRQEEGEDAKVIALAPVVLLGIPVVELTHKAQRLAGGRPLAVPDAGHAFLLTAVDAEELVPALLGEAVHAALVVVDGLADVLVHAPAVLEVLRMAPQAVVPLEALGAIVVGDGAHGRQLGLVQDAAGAGGALGAPAGRGPHALVVRCPRRRRRHRHAGLLQLLLQLIHRAVGRLNGAAQQLVLLLDHLQRRLALAGGDGHLHAATLQRGGAPEGAARARSERGGGGHPRAHGGALHNGGHLVGVGTWEGGVESLVGNETTGPGVG
mmetsp:Transcript_34329/g.87789  ORF Transcript_34329/g.87789 Transcript_34329/m.87789 type:complete len:515 (+) Transcript_34329:637-2181(+)